MFKNIRNLFRNNNGFTILELIVVIAIMGFLIALVAPKLAGVADTAKSPTCDTNQQRISDAIERNITEKGNYPNNLRNLVSGTISLGSEVNSEVFSEKLLKNNHLYFHKLNQDEIQELKDMGVTHLIDYNTGSKKDIGSDTTKDEIDTVLMIGAGAETDSETDILIEKDTKFTNPDLIYRIVLGIGSDNELMKEGMLSSLGTCPDSQQGSDSTKYHNYSMVLPRLKSTVKRIKDENEKFKGIYVTRDNDVETEKNFKITVSQEISHFDILCPEGHIWPEPKSKDWFVPKPKPEAEPEP